MKTVFRALMKVGALGYGIGMIVLITLFFFNYGGRFMQAIARWLPVHQ